MQSPVSRQADAVLEKTDRLLVIVGGSSFSGDLLRRLAAEGALVVGADGGADAALAAGVTPQLVIGDFDSLSDPEAWRTRARVVHIAEQETTDFEKCLYSVETPMTVALGMTGGRFDHTLAALHAVTRHGATRRIVLVDEVDAALALSGPMTLELPAGTRVSVYPLQQVEFSHSEGLLYPLDGLTLAAGIRTGTSNEATGGMVRIVPAVGQSGTWLLVLPVGLLPQLLAIKAG
jgi:thiamine pyrophosphokinase